MLEALSEQLTALDRNFSSLLQRMQPDQGNDELLMAAMLASWSVGQGHSAFDLRGTAGKVWPQDEPALTLPECADWEAALAGAPDLVGPPGAALPLNYNQSTGLLYLRRYNAYENRVAAHISDRSEPLPFNGENRLQALFNGTDAGSIGQREAARKAVSSRFCVISGGPGTGKTTTVARVLDLLLHENPDLRIALAAPSGKAADRLNESIREAIEKAASSDVPLHENMPEDRAVTIHRLLKWRGTAPEHNANNPLHCDLLLVDEASMVSLALFAHLFGALPPSCRILLLGDKNQLAAVDTGNVLSDLSDAPVNLVELAHSYRFDDSSGIGAVAQRLLSGDLGDDWAALPKRYDHLYYCAPDESLENYIREGFAPFKASLRSGPAEVLRALQGFRMICAVNRGDRGVEGLCHQARRILFPRINDRVLYYHGMPIMIGSNDHELGLFNGNCGVILKDATGLFRAWFPTENPDEPKAYPVGLLPSFSPAFAITVHKAQGSEFDHILFVLPEIDVPLLSRELTYTAITRAKTRLGISGDPALLAAAAARPCTRTSGLAAALK